MRLCPDCGHLRRDSSFYKRSGKPSGYCIACNSKRSKEWRLRMGRAYCSEERRRNKLRYEYGITEEDFQRMLEAQDHRCGICLAPAKGRLHVDHNHDTGKVRGLLCHKCNSAIGMLGDNVTLLTSAVQYLFEHGAKFGRETNRTDGLRSGIDAGRSSP